jgi:signal transduction histidine kinase
VLCNLLNNALDFTPRGGRVTTVVRPDGQWVRVEVRDTGRGIAPEHLPLVFERFYRADKSRTRATGGAGLGLAIVKQLVEAHGGRVWADSAVGAGSVFSFVLPVAVESS